MTGVLTIPVVTEFPSAPLLALPQVHKVPSVLIAAICMLPTLTCFQLFPPKNVVTGVDTLVVTAFPSLPSDPLPQVHKVPSVLIATVKRYPALNCFQFIPPENVVIGVNILILNVESPSCPLLPLPQTHNPPSRNQSAGTKISSKL